ncbi:MAG: helix-turn-helix transcriptional regulator [Candidatus Yonathbacteria bacterium]|nr:helix-turn-helix transcriptional regulator [Candidatus Yonathbacteria bacterium]NTW47771.1 helix-turn-helix transcriptional regulator [Candidatus Yonathbacteria bacterium]
MKIIIRNIDFLRHQSGMNQTEFAQETGISRESLYRYAKLEWFISLKNMVACASLLGVHISRLLLTQEEILNELSILRNIFPRVHNPDGVVYTPYTYEIYRRVLADNIFHMRHKKHVSLQDLAKQTNGIMTYMSFNRYENRTSPTHPKVIVPVAQVLKTTVIGLTSKEEDIPHIMASLTYRRHTLQIIN